MPDGLTFAALLTAAGAGIAGGNAHTGDQDGAD